MLQRFSWVLVWAVSLGEFCEITSGLGLSICPFWASRRPAARSDVGSNHQWYFYFVFLRLYIWAQASEFRSSHAHFSSNFFSLNRLSLPGPVFPKENMRCDFVLQRFLNTMGTSYNFFWDCCIFFSLRIYI